MNEVADSVRRLFVEWGLIDDRTARRPWCLDDGLAALATTPLYGERALIYEAAMDVWTSYCNVRNARERWIEQLGAVADVLVQLKALRAEPASEAYLLSVSNVGSVVSLQGEPRTRRSIGLKARVDNVMAQLEAARAETAEIADALVERRQVGLAAAFYGPNGGGPRPHYAFALRAAGFSDSRIAEIRGDVRPRRVGLEDPEWDSLLEKAAKEVYLENYRTDARLAKLGAKAVGS